MDEKILRHFDLSTQYGVCNAITSTYTLHNLLIHTIQPCIGITRVRRWRRANMLDLDPPIEVLAVLLKERKTHVNKHAYVDELLA